ncbi:MAG TPA: hypothetical protein VGF48_09200 [Thermoanaerobaculia bacterium]|jgi:hypothetical protein
MFRRLLVFLALALALPLAAQPVGTSEPGALRSDVRLNFFVFDNFFWSSDPARERDTTALGTELRTAYRWSQSPAELYGHAHLVHYNDDDLDTAYGARLGIAQNAPVHDYNFYLEHAANRPSAPVRNTFGTSDITALSGRYAYQFSPAWQFGADGHIERQRFDGVQPRRDNNFRAVGAVARYQGFGWRITPLAGVQAGARNFSETNDDFSQRAIYGGVEWIPRDPLYLSATLRNITRDFDQGSDETDLQMELIASYSISPRLRGMGYFLRDDISVDNGEDFDTQILLLGIAYGF